MASELKRVMLIDDDELISEFAVMILESFGFEVQYCDSGQKALACVDEFQPHVVLLDFIMPEMNGIETLLALRCISDLQGAPVIFLTGKANDAEGDAAMMDAGAAGIIRKPFAPDKLQSDIEAIWQKHVA